VFWWMVRVERRGRRGSSAGESEDAEGLAHAEEESLELKAELSGGGLIGGGEGGGELIGFASAEKEAGHVFERLREQAESGRAFLQMSERNMRGDVLEAGIAKDIVEGLMAAIAHESAAGEADDFTGGVAVVDGDDGTGMKRGGHAVKGRAETDGELDEEVRAVIEAGGERIEVVAPFGGDGFGGLPGEGVVEKGHAHKESLAAADGCDVNGEGIEEFVGEDDAGEGGGIIDSGGVDGEVMEVREVRGEFGAAGAPIGDGEGIGMAEAGAE